MFGLLLDDIERVKEYSEKTNLYKPEWRGVNMQNINHYITKVPSISKTRIYVSSSGFFLNLEERNDKTKTIIKLMELFELEIRRYDKVEYRNKQYFAYECYPDIEIKRKIESFKDVHISGKLLLIFYWIFGIKGHYILRDEIFYPSEPYIIDFEKSKISKRSSSKFIKKNFKDFKNLFAIFTEQSKIIDAKLILNDYRYWSVESMKRLRLLY